MIFQHFRKYNTDSANCSNYITCKSLKISKCSVLSMNTANKIKHPSGFASLDIVIHAWPQQPQFSMKFNHFRKCLAFLSKKNVTKHFSQQGQGFANSSKFPSLAFNSGKSRLIHAMLSGLVVFYPLGFKKKAQKQIWSHGCILIFQCYSHCESELI